LNTSREKKAAAVITGILCDDPVFFLQCLEGPKNAVNELYNQILRDVRHTDVVLLEYADIAERTFGSWTIGFLKSSEADRETVSACAKGNRFDSYLLTGEQARNFLVKIAAQERKRLDMQPRRNTPRKAVPTNWLVQVERRTGFDLSRAVK